MEHAHRLQSAKVLRRHVLDGCQLLNIPSVMKHSSASLEALSRLIAHCRNKALTRIALFRWLVFNILVGKNDNHLKNLFFFVSHQGIELAPHYDLLCTLAYDTKALSGTADLNDWSERPLAFPFPSATQFRQVKRPAWPKPGSRWAWLQAWRAAFWTRRVALSTRPPQSCCATMHRTSRATHNTCVLPWPCAIS